MNKFAVARSAVFLATILHTTAGQCAPQLALLTYEEASAFERALLGVESTTPEAPAILYTQPVNKKEPCKLPTSQDQISRPNFRAYWDGECKDGFAFGLGRDIAISDTHHVEEITVHDKQASDWSKPRVAYDYVNNTIGYAVGGSKYPAGTVMSERYDDSIQGFNAYQRISVIDDAGKVFDIETSAFHPQRVYRYSRLGKHAGYEFTDHSAIPSVNKNPVSFTAEIFDLRTNTQGGVAIAITADRSVMHFIVVNGKPVPAVIPSRYAEHLMSRFEEIVSATASANTVLAEAQQIEREYLFKACNGKSGISGLESTVYTKICSWRNQFKEPYARASANYQAKLEGMRQSAATAEQRRQIQDQISLQQQQLQQQRNQLAWNVAIQGRSQSDQGYQLLQQSNQLLQQSTQQIIQNARSWQAPQIQPITPMGSGKVICNSVGSITMCR